MIEKNNHPTIVVITPVRNEAWVLDAFLTCASAWADIIIVADQHSTDGSREIAAKYAKVTLIDNDAVEMNQAAVRLLLFEEVDKIEGDKIVFALDADEFLSKGFEKTDGWQRILNSKQDELFCFKWQNVYGDFKTVIPEGDYVEWACHFASGTRVSDLYRQCEVRSVHEMRVPCLPAGQVSYVAIPDIKFVHLARLNLVRQRNKEDFYQVSTLAKLSKRISAVSLYRSYHHPEPKIESLAQPVGLHVQGSDENMAYLVKEGDQGWYYIEEMKAIILRDGFKKYQKIDIWDNPYLKVAGITHKVPARYRLLHWYLIKTHTVADYKMVRLVDKILKLFV